MRVLNNVILLLLWIATSSNLLEACLVQQSANKILENHWDYMTVPRKIDKSCECGKYDSDNWDSPWNLYIHVNRGSLSKTCTGTIIASNLLVTSHKCLQLDGKRMRIYDILKLNMKKSDFALVEEVTVSNTKSPRHNTIRFKVTDIFHNPQFALTSERKIYPENDLVLIKVKENLFTHSEGYSPICVPVYDDKTRIGNMSGFYYGHTTHVSDLFLRMESDVPHRHFGTILEKRVCYSQLLVRSAEEEKEESFDKTLCFMFERREKHTKMEGGPLIYSETPTSPAFLMGVATVITVNPDASGYEASTGQDRAYFSSIKPLVKFIEYFAAKGKDKSVWCKTPKLRLKKMDKLPSSNQLVPHAQWPWEELETPTERDESLECSCGLQSSQSASGRIVGGSEVAEREYGWMALLFIYKEGRDKGPSLCGGSIINNRVILTAAHCVVDDYKLNEEYSRFSVDPADVDVTLNVHSKVGDPNGIKKEVTAVLFYPDYAHARKSKPMYYELDVALFILKERIDFVKKGPGLRPVCLPPQGSYMPVVGEMATVAGWGMTHPTNAGSSAQKLMHIQVPIADMSLCRTISSTASDNFLCAGTLNRFKDAARGDSGGPLMIQNEQTGRWTQVGIVSYGEDAFKHEFKTAALYTDVQKVLPFIDFHSKRVGASYCVPKR